MTKTEFKQKFVACAEGFPLARRMLGTSELAHDAVQQSMMKLWENRKDLSKWLM